VRRVWWSWFGGFPGKTAVVTTSVVLGVIASRMNGGMLGSAKWLLISPVLAWAIFSTPQSELVVMNQFRAPEWRDGVCLQSTGFTCAPAAGATVLNVYHIHTDEAEMASRCSTHEDGTYMKDLASGLSQMLPGEHFKVYCCRLTPRELGSVHLPCITCNT